MKYVKYIYAMLVVVGLALPKIAFGLIIHTGVAAKNLVMPEKSNERHLAEPAECGGGE